MRAESFEFLQAMLTTPSPSGYESKIQKIWCDYVRPFADEIRTDAYGNAVAVLNPAGDPKLLIDGHVDEIGLMVKHIAKEGFIYFQQIGGVDAALVRSKRVNIHTAKGIVRGVIGATAIHIAKRDKDPYIRGRLRDARQKHSCLACVGQSHRLLDSSRDAPHDSGGQGETKVCPVRVQLCAGRDRLQRRADAGCKHSA